MLTLLTDFGLSDVYVGVMKGVISQINPHLSVIDLTHQIPPQNIMAARFCLMNAYRYFPDGTVHLGVVDPGVGSTRRAIAVEFATGFLVGPDNGIFSGVLSQNPALAAVELTNSDYWRFGQSSATFHGRDIFAPVAAHLASRVALDDLGSAIDITSLVKLEIPNSTVTDTSIQGCIQYIDGFGNLITNILGDDVVDKRWIVVAGGIEIPAGKTYSAQPQGSIVAFVGSHGWIEIAVNGGSARSQLHLNYLDPVQVLF
jgi:S-adenosylmethionine hydrolase